VLFGRLTVKEKPVQYTGVELALADEVVAWRKWHAERNVVDDQITLAPVLRCIDNTNLSPKCLALLERIRVVEQIIAGWRRSSTTDRSKRP
jgi:hypothetical protein